MKIMNNPSRLLITLTFILALASCDSSSTGFTPAKLEKVGSTGFKTEQEVVALLGSGDVVKEANANAVMIKEAFTDPDMNKLYIDSIVSDHKLPASARILRYRDSTQPGVLFHVVFVDGKYVETDIWDTRKKP